MMDKSTIAARFEEAKAKVVSAKSLCMESGNTYQGLPAKPAGILAWETIAPDFSDRGKVRYFLVVADHVPRKHWPFEDDGSFPPGTEGVILAKLDDNLKLADWDGESKTIDGLMFEHCEAGGSMEMLSARYEGTRNFRVTILFNASMPAEEQDRELSAARERLKDTSLPPELQKYVDILLKTEDQERFHRAAFEIWNEEELVRKHLDKLGAVMIVAVTRGVDSVAALWMCRQLCVFDCPVGVLAPYAILLCQYALNPPVSDARRTLQWAAIEGLMNVTSKLPDECAADILKAIGAELQLGNPYGTFIEHAIYVLGSIGSPAVRPVLEKLQPAFPSAVFWALEHYGHATPAQIKAKAGRAV